MTFQQGPFVAELAALLTKHGVSAHRINVSARPAESMDDCEARFSLDVEGGWE